MSRAAIEAAIETIEGMSVLDLANLRDQLSERWGVQWPTSPVPTALPPGEQAVVEEQTAFDLVLTSYGPNKIAVIKAVREITSLGLKEAKALVESAPIEVRFAVPKADAEAMLAKLISAGATAGVK